MIDYIKLDKKIKQNRIRFESHIKPMILEYINKTGNNFNISKETYSIKVEYGIFWAWDKISDSSGLYWYKDSPINSKLDKEKEYNLISRIYCEHEIDIIDKINRDIERLLK